MSTYNPMIECKPYKNGFYAKMPLVDGERAVILSIKGIDAAPAVIDSTGGPAIKVIKKNKYDWQTDIDTAKHMVDLEFKAGSSNYVYSFIIKAKFTVQVIRPLVIFREQVKDAAECIKRSIEGGIQEAARGFDINMAPDLQRKLKADYGKPMQLDGFEIRLDSMSVDIDEEAKAHLKKIIQVKENEELRLHEAESAKKVGMSLEDDTGILISILQGDKPAEDITEFRRTLKKNNFNDQLEYARQMMDFVQDMVEKGQFSEAEAQKAMRTVLGSAGVDLLGTGECAAGQEDETGRTLETETYASFDE